MVLYKSQTQPHNNRNFAQNRPNFAPNFTKITPTGYFRHQNVHFRSNFCFLSPKTTDFSSRKSYNLLNISIKTTFSGDVGVQHHPNITLNDTRSAPYHKGPAKRVMLVRSKNKNFLVEIFLLTMCSVLNKLTV